MLSVILKILTTPRSLSLRFSFLLIWTSILVSPRDIRRACHTVNNPNATCIKTYK